MSLISYEESEKGDEKYYNEEELINILGSQIGKEKNSKIKNDIKSKFMVKLNI